MTMRDELEPFASTGREASGFVDELIDRIIEMLRYDPRFAGTKLQDLELRFASLRTETERRLFDMFRDRVHLDHIDYVAGADEP